ncbi:MAG: methylated-DNA--[protein]-cysteine S-methyltransferase [Reyranellaceae bacterium]
MAQARNAANFTLFDTPIGRCGLLWGADGIAGLQLPERNDGETQARLLRLAPDAIAAEPPRPVRQAIEQIVALLRGEKRDLSAIALDMARVPEFHRQVYAFSRRIPPGQTLSYGEIAARIGRKGAARAVGQAMGRNPFPIIVPCHRVLAAGRKLGGFSANGGIATKLKLLHIEGARAEHEPAHEAAPAAPDYSAAVAHLRQIDPALAKVIDLVGPCGLQINATQSLFIALAEAIVYQQLTAKAAATIFARVRALFPHAHNGPTPLQILRASDARLRSAGLSGAKAAALRDLARKAADGQIPELKDLHAMDDAQIVASLTQIRGIGRWTVEMLLMFRLGRPDILPLDDYGIRKGIAVIDRKRALPEKAAMEKRGRRWSPYRSVASWYLWRAADLKKLPA